MNFFIRRSSSFPLKSLADLHRSSSSAIYVNKADPSSLDLWKSAKQFKQISGPKCYPVIGALPTFLTSITENRPIGIVSLDWFKEYGSLYKLIIPGMSPTLFTTDPEVFKVMVQNEASNKYPLRGLGFEDKLGWVSHKINVPLAPPPTVKSFLYLCVRSILNHSVHVQFCWSKCPLQINAIIPQYRVGQYLYFILCFFPS